MRAVVVYESMFGNTRLIAEQVAEGLRTGIGDVEVVPVAEADKAQLAGADLLVVGGPTHVHSLSSVRSRKAAVTEPDRYGGGAQPEPGAGGTGLREWFQGLSGQSLTPRGGAAAAFDTRAGGPAVLTGRASRAIAKRLAARGFRLVGGSESFVVESAHLAEGEPERARRWGRSLAATVCHERLDDTPFAEPE